MQSYLHMYRSIHNCLFHLPFQVIVCMNRQLPDNTLHEQIYFMSLNEKNGNYWLRKRAVANSTPVSDVSSTTKVKKFTKQINSRTMLSHVPLASEDEYIVAVPDSEDSSSDSDESDSEKGLNTDPVEISTLSVHVPDKFDESSQGTSDQQHQEEYQEHQEKTEEVSY